jgi:hypothetical protein
LRPTHRLARVVILTAFSLPTILKRKRGEKPDT